MYKFVQKLKDMKKGIIVALLALVSFSSTFAADYKFGHVNTADVMTNLPEVTQAEASLAEFNKQLEGQLQNMYAEYQNKVNEFQSQEATMADIIKQDKLQEIQGIEQRIQQFQGTAQQQVLVKKEELYAPIIKKVEDVIKAIAAEKKYSYIFDMSTGVVLFAQDSDDITSLVKERLAAL